MRSRFFKFFWPAGMEVRLVRRGCANRPFFQVGVVPAYKGKERAPDEVIGSFDPMLNENNEKLFAVDLTRLAFWIGQGAKMTPEVSHMLGMVGFLPVDPLTYQKAKNDREKATQTNVEEPSTQQ